MSAEWTHIRIRTDTKDRLETYRDLVDDRGLDAVRTTHAKWDCYVSIDSTINRLLDLIDQHRERARRASAGKPESESAGRSSAGDGTP